MSQVSQSRTPPRLGFAGYFAILMTVIGLIVAAAMGPVRGYAAKAAANAHLHAPDIDLFVSLSPAIKIHLMAALMALALGAALMTLRKGKTFHRTAGWTWVTLVFVTAGSSLFITRLNHGHWSLLHLLSGWTLLILPLAVIWARRHDIARHRRAMMGLFYGGFAINLIIAFIPGRTLWMMVLG